MTINKEIQERTIWNLFFSQKQKQNKQLKKIKTFEQAKNCVWRFITAIMGVWKLIL